MDFEGGGREIRREKFPTISGPKNDFYYLLESHLKHKNISLASDERIAFNKSQIQQE